MFCNVLGELLVSRAIFILFIEIRNVIWPVILAMIHYDGIKYL